MSLLVSYVRTSGDKAESTSLDDQLRKITAKCDLDGHELIAHFADKESAETVVKRRGFQAALDYVYSGQADGICVFKLSRFARSVLDGVNILNEFQRLGKQLVCVADPIDTTSPLGAAFFQIAMVFAELERKQIGELCESGRQARARQKRYAGGKPGYLLRAERDQEGRKTLTLDSDRERVVELIRLMHDEEYMSFNEIARSLTEMGIQRPQRYKGVYGPWAKLTVMNLYHGKYTKLQDWVRAGQTYNYLEH